VANVHAGSNAGMTVMRNGSAHTLNVTIGDEAKATKVAANAPAATPASVPHPVGMSLAANDNGNGVTVNSVIPGSHADESGLQAGDIIERVNGAKVTNPAQVADAITKAEQQNREAVSLLVNRDGQSSFLGLQLV
jgi:serine protease Do